MKPENETVINNFLDLLYQQGLDSGRNLFVDCLILNYKNQVFAQKRSPERRKFPNCWDLPGGGIDPGESIKQAAARELKEELNFDLKDIIAILGIHNFELPENMRSSYEEPKMRIFQLLVTVHDYTSPILEEGKAVKYEWFDESNIDTLMEDRPLESIDDRYMVEIVQKALNWKLKM
jgi:8-oxo-dGTP diphosphatase